EGRWSRFLRLTDPEKQVVFLFLQVVIAGLKRAKLVLSSLLFCSILICLLRRFRFPPRGFCLLLSDLVESGTLLCRVIRGSLRIITEALLNVLVKFGEINFGDACLIGSHDAVRFDAAHCGVLIFLSSNCFKIVSLRD